MARLAAGLCQNLDDIGQRLLDLRDKIVTLEFAAGVPPDLPRDKNLPALGGDAVAIALARGPMLGCKICGSLEDMAARFQDCCRSLKRWILPVCVFGKASMKLTARGYL